MISYNIGEARRLNKLISQKADSSDVHRLNEGMRELADIVAMCKAHSIV